MKCIDHYMLKRFCYSCSPFVLLHTGVKKNSVQFLLLHVCAKKESENEMWSLLKNKTKKLLLTGSAHLDDITLLKLQNTV